MAVALEPRLSSHIQRQTLCLAGSSPGLATHAGEDDFAQRLQNHYQADESNVAEQLINFKHELSKLDGEPFWSRLMTGMTDICHSQFAFVSKRILVNDQKTVVEMPQIGEAGSCLMAVALYYNNNEDIHALHHDYKYYAWSCPCAYMKHDKVFLIAEDLSRFITENPNQLPFEFEAYLGVPLFAHGKCYAHFGMMWTKEGMTRRQNLSWAFVEMFMHSLEDMITSKLLAGKGFAKSAEQMQSEKPRVIPQAAITATQSLKLYARSLSHELRTPMQGVVGMLDLMYATVQEQIEGGNNPKIRKIFQSLKNNIEVVQDSSKRAVEAADNVVHAYDLNLQVPESPSANHGTASMQNASYFEVRRSMTEGSQIVNPNKKKRTLENAFGSTTDGNVQSTGIPRKERRTSDELSLSKTLGSENASPQRSSSPASPGGGVLGTLVMPTPRSFYHNDLDSRVSTPGPRHSNIREVLPIVINDSLRTGGRPDFAVSEPTSLGERIEVKTRSSNGGSSSKIVAWSVEPDVPYMIPLDERDLTKLVGAVFLNSLKFTDHGDIDIHVYLDSRKRYILIDISDTGIGIPETFQPELFKAFSKEDDSITRTTEGLGLGLLVAKGLARKVGGDLELIRSAVQGPEHGSQFQVRIPLEPGERSSRSTTPFGQKFEAVAPRSVAPAQQPRHIDTRIASPSPKPTSPAELTSPNHARVSKPVEQRKNTETKSGESAKRAVPPANRRMSSTSRLAPKPDRQLAQKYPLTFLVAEDNKINRKLLVQMLNTLGYKDVHEAHDGREAVRVMQKLVREQSAKQSSKRWNSSPALTSAVDVVLMDLWMPELDGYQASEQIFDIFKPNMARSGNDVDVNSPTVAQGLPPTILAVSADVTDAAIDRATEIGMAGYMSKPFKVLDLQRLILEFCVARLGSMALTSA